MFVLWFAACAPDLPPGWEGAAPVDALEQTACDHSLPDTGVVSEVSADLDGAPLTVEATAVSFRCAQDVEGFWKQDGDRVDVLVQPIDMHPRGVAKCDCLYDLAIELTPEASPASVAVWKRSDDLNDPNPPREVGRAP